ncbi:DUF6093 family protein [Streptomyces uncialis]|uniref:DUF6093 family protein n=1 Tax=Streptomyces uncialis TaxID=1048205 RepID=UPI00381A1C84
MTTASDGLALGGVAALIERKILTDKVRIFRPGDPVFDPETGLMAPGPDMVIYEGRGAIVPEDGTGVSVRLEGAPHPDDTASRYLMLTPLAAPLSSRGDAVKLVESADPAMLGRTWRATDLAEGSTIAVVRRTALDQTTQTT